MTQWIDFQKTLPQRLVREDLDSNQNRAKNYSINGHGLVRGVAGSGKSLVLRNRVERLIEEFDDILILSYNRFMNGWLSSKLEEKGFSGKITCKTFHSWAYNYLGYDYKWDRNDETRQEVINLAENSKVSYEAILVDEAQDFYDEWFKALLHILDPNTNSLLFVYDNTQSVYGQEHRRKSSWQWNKLGFDIPGGRSQVFDTNYRNAPEILEMAWTFIKPALDASNMEVGRRERDNQGNMRSPGIGFIIEPKKKLSRSSNIAPLLLQINQQSMAVEIAQQVQRALATHQHSSIGILLHPQSRDLKFAISRELSSLGIIHHAPRSSRDRQHNVVDRPYIIVDSWNALKGVEFDAVLVAGLDAVLEDADDNDLDFQEKAGLYTAMTRARDHLVILYERETSIVEQLQSALTAPVQLEAEP